MSQAFSPVRDGWVEKMKEEITCPICREVFVEPKQLPGCLHTFCNGCIVMIFKRNSACTPECPLCRIPLPDLDSIKRDFHMEGFVQLYHERMAEQGNEASAQETDDRASPRTPVTQSANALEDSIFFDKMAGGARKELQQLVEPLHGKHKKVSSALDKLECTKHEFQAKHDADCTEVQDFFAQLRDALDKQEEDCLQKLNEILKSSLKVLSQQTQDLSDLEAELDSCKTTLSTLIQSKNYPQVLEMESRVKQGAKELVKKVDVSSQLEPECTPSTTVLYGDQEKFTEACKLLCQVCSTAYAPNCSISYVTDHIISVTRPVVVSIVLQDIHDNPVINQPDHFELHSNLGNDYIDGVKVIETAPGAYDINYFPKVRYAHKLEIYHKNCLVAHADVKSLVVCDYSMTEQKVIETFDHNKRFNRPSGLALGPHEEIVVSDRGLHQLIVFDAKLQFRCEIGCKGHGNGEFNWPSGIVVDSTGYIYIADRKNHRIQKVRLEDGKFISKMGQKGTGNGEFNEPRAVALMPRDEDRLFIADSLNHRIQVFQKEKFLFSFGQHGSGPCEFDLPASIAFNRTEEVVFIADNRNHRVQMFTIHGEHQKEFGDSTNIPNKLPHAQGIHWSKDGHVLVSCSGNGTIFIFKEDGTFVSAIKSLMDRPGELVTNSKGHMISTNHKGIVVMGETSKLSPCI